MSSIKQKNQAKKHLIIARKNEKAKDNKVIKNTIKKEISQDVTIESDDYLGVEISLFSRS